MGKHGTIIRTGIAWKKIPCYMHDSACRWFVVKKAKMFQSYVKHFWLVYANKPFWIAQSYFSYF